MALVGTGHNDSGVVRLVEGADLTGKEFMAVKFNDSGNVVMAGAGENAIGLLAAEQENYVAEHTDPKYVDVQIKDIAYGKAGAAFAHGDLLAADANGKLVEATTGAHIIAFALEAATGADAIVSVQIIRAGAKA